MKGKAISRITMATGVLAMSIGLVNAFSLETQAATTTGGKFVAVVITCATNGTPTSYGCSCDKGSSTCTPNPCPPPPAP